MTTNTKGMEIYTAIFHGDGRNDDVATRLFLKRCLRAQGLVCLDITSRHVDADSPREARDIVCGKAPSTAITAPIGAIPVREPQSAPDLQPWAARISVAGVAGRDR